MTDQPPKAGDKLDKGHFKTGYDPRRWLRGRPKKPANMKIAEELIQHVIWEILSEEITNPATGEKVDRLRAMLRSMSTNKNMQDKLLDRILGKVSQPLDIGGEGKVEIVITHEDTHKTTDPA